MSGLGMDLIWSMLDWQAQTLLQVWLPSRGHSLPRQGIRRVW
jgi:hypothetical protein